MTSLDPDKYPKQKQKINFLDNILKIEYQGNIYLYHRNTKLLEKIPHRKIVTDNQLIKKLKIILGPGIIEFVRKSK